MTVDRNSDAPGVAQKLPIVPGCVAWRLISPCVSCPDSSEVRFPVVRDPFCKEFPLFEGSPTYYNSLNILVYYNILTLYPLPRS